MSNNNGGGLGVIVLLLLFGYIIFWIVVAVSVAAYALMSFWAIVLTLISVFAWNRPRRFFHLGISPYQARGIVCFGLVGAVLLPCFGLFCEWLLEYPLKGQIWFHLLMAGYAMGAVGFAREQSFEASRIEYYDLREVPALPPQPKAALPAPRSFDYADWQDPPERLE